jgi:hypothetical protein
MSFLQLAIRIAEEKLKIKAEALVLIIFQVVSRERILKKITKLIYPED